MTVRVPSEHKSSADHNGGQPGCKWTSQIWNIAHCLGALGRGHCAYTYDISQICRNMMCFHSRIDKLWISPVILMWQLVEKKFYKLLSRSVWQQYLQNITIQPTVGCYNLWADICCWGCSPLGEIRCETGLLLFSRHSGVVGASPVGAAPTTSSFST